jgi:hypothetical protein
MLTACLKKEEIKFSDILDGVIIKKIEFRNGGNGFLYRTEDKAMIKEFDDLLNVTIFKKVKTPKPYTGYLYSGKINDKIEIGFAMGNLIFDGIYYNIQNGNEEFYSKLTKIVESFGRVMPKDGVIP